jgi:hypothetical protein
MTRRSAQERREKYKEEYWPSDIAWTGERPEVGWFRAPRTLPLILMLLSSKKVSGKQDPTRVYLELLARQRDTGIVEMATEADHSYAAGYPGSRGIRTWQERMKLLQDLGFIKSVRGGNLTHKFVLLIHPTIAVKKLHDGGKVEKAWWDTYRQMQIETKESTYEQLMERCQRLEAARKRESSRPSSIQKTGRHNGADLLSQFIRQPDRKVTRDSKKSPAAPAKVRKRKRG